ncbi:BLUF domain-containing protein [Nocardioides sp. ChNu-99]|uniref:BLUF domain-containing protein n=1 Tax=Nocardioides sp. ChNu-99 TaxID=2839897 RepID=UPI0024057C06|nr:BLUF domain-containing protein [Nocardioides sp. ChNu-99]MDF9715796.1 BLUF domain-containing protein [Nocardioides sp. ChNu-99]
MSGDGGDLPGDGGDLPGDGGGLLSLTYLSSAVPKLTSEDLAAILAYSRASNAAVGVIGALLYADGKIVQTLEGPRETVRSLFATISADPRHRGVLVVVEEEVDERAFPEWTMGFRELGADAMAAVPGFTDFLRTGVDLSPGAGAPGLAATFHRVFRENVR